MWHPPPNSFFEVKPPTAQAQWGLPAPVEQPTNDYRNDESKKKAYGIALAKQGSMDLQAAFKAGCEVFPDNTNRALWVAHNWLNDAAVVAARDLYADSVRKEPEILDKDQFASRVLACAEEKIERDGKLYPAIEAKDKLGFLRLYAEIKGYVGKTEINNNLNFTHNEMKVKLVKPEPTVSKVIEHEEEIIPQLEAPSSIKLKLVK